MSFNDKKNMFQYDALSDYEKRRRASEAKASKPSAMTRSTADMANEYVDVDNAMKSGNWYGGGEVDNFASSIGPMYGQDGYEGAHKNWENYGTSATGGNAYSDDFNFDISQSDIIEANYGASKDNYLTQKQQNKQAIDMYNKAIADANKADQNAYINKIMGQQNAQSQSTALGRGGLGTTQGGNSRLNNNYENHLNNIADNTNDNIDNVYNQYMSTALALENNSNSLEQQSKISYHDFLIGQAQGLYGDDSVVGENNVTPHIKDVFTGDDGKEFVSNVDADGDGEMDRLVSKSFINSESEELLNKDIDTYFDNDINDYFIKESTIRGDLKEGVAEYGSKNEEYLNAVKFYEQNDPVRIKEREADRQKKDQIIKNEEAIARGAEGTATVSHNVPNAAQGTIGSGITQSVSNSFASNWDTTYKGDNYVLEENWAGMGLKSYNKKLNSDQPELVKNKIDGDVIFVDGEGNFVLYDGKWRKMVAK